MCPISIENWTNSLLFTGPNSESIQNVKLVVATSDELYHKANKDIDQRIICTNTEREKESESEQGTEGHFQRKFNQFKCSLCFVG